LGPAGAESMASFGETLKRERELREISLRQISEATKINIRYLEALEGNRFECLPGGLFNKGFIRAYAKYIGIDGEAMVDSYLHEIGLRQPGADAVAAAPTEQSPLHRPAMVPQRRASAPAPAEAPPGRPRRAPTAPAAAAVARTAEPAAPTAPEPRPVPKADRPSPARAPVKPAPAARTHSIENPILEGFERLTGVRPAVSGIEVADQATPRSSRVLFWILSLVATTGVLFLVMSLVRGTSPSSSRVRLEPAAAAGGGNESATGGAVTTGGGGVPENDGTPVPESGKAPVVDPKDAAPAGAHAVLPDMSSTSPIALGALDVPRQKTPAGHAATPRPTPPARTATPLPPPETAPPPLEKPLAEKPPSRKRGSMAVTLETSGRTFVQLLCDGKEIVNRMMEEGETTSAECFGVVRISTGDAGMAHVSMNGVTCMPLGDPGARVYGYTIRIDDYNRICPATGRGADADR